MFRLALGAGHGLTTPGKRCMKSLDPKETREWFLNDRICDYVQQELTAYQGISILRLDDSDDGADDVALESRVKAANQWGADFYLSVHHNAGASGGTAGGIVAFSLANTGEGSKWRDALYTALIKHTGLRGNRANPKATGNYYVLRKTHAPAVLLELGFMDSRKDVPIILTDDYARKCAKAIAEVIAQRAGLQRKKACVNLQQYGAALRDVERLAWVPASGSRGETVSAAAKQIRWNGRAPDAICNAELFTAAMKPASGCSDHVTQTLGFAFVQGRTPVLSYANNRKAEHWIGSYPMLLRDGKLAFDAVPRGLEGKRARTALGISDTHFAFFFVKEADGCTLQELAEAIRERGFHTAVNLDGGGSTSCVTPFVVYEQGRRVRGKIAMWVKGGKGNKLAGG